MRYASTPLLSKEACKLLGVATFTDEFRFSVCKCNNNDDIVSLLIC